MSDVTVELKSLRLQRMAGAWVDLVEQSGKDALDTSRWLGNLCKNPGQPWLQLCA